jgi:hypothetical protein
LLQRSNVDRRIKDQRYQHQVEEDLQRAKENRLSVFQGSNNKKEKKKNNSEEDDLIYGPRNCDIGKSPSIKLHHLLLCENSADQHLVTTAMVDRDIKAGTLDMDYFCLGCHVEIMSSCVWNIRSSLEVNASQSRMQGDSLFSFSQLIMSAELLFFFFCRMNFWQRVAVLARTIFT